MRFRSLKTNLAVYLALFLLISIGLTDFVTVRIIQNRIIETKILSAHELVRQVDDDMGHHLISFNAFAYLVERHFHHDFDVRYIGLLFSNRKRMSHGSINAALKHEIYQDQEQALLSGTGHTRYSGETWGVFWQQKKYGIVTVPLRMHQGVCSVVVALDPIYQMLRSSQRMIIIYMFINLLIVLLIATYRLSRMVIRPIHRYIKISESFIDSEHFDFFPEKKHNEFSRLSVALNHMLQRIDSDTKKLQTSLNALETANQELQTAQNEIIRAEKLASIGRLSAGIAHEIGNPIGIILGYLGLLKTKVNAAGDKNSMDYIERAENEINRINVIIRQLLNFSRMTSIDVSAISIHAVISDVAEMLSHQPLTSNIEIKLDLSASKDMVFADYNQIRQVIMNLVINAADSIAQSDRSANGLIRFSTCLVSPGEQDGKPTLLISVEDNGTGIDKSDLDKIFDPFFTTKEPGKGTGLGLSVCYMIIEQIGGKISATSSPEKGTTIILYLPLFEEEHQPSSFDNFNQ